jgi:hypothetical protein
MMKFKVKGCGLDTTTTTYLFDNDEHSFQYIHTSIGVGNDYLLKKSLSAVSGTLYSVEVDFVEKLPEMLKRHMEILEISQINMLFFNASLGKEKITRAIKEIKDESLPIENYGIKDPKNVKEIEELLDPEQEGTPDLVSVGMNVSPTDFDLESVEYCKKYGIPLFGFNPLGGYISAPRNIQALTVPYLLEFSAAHVDVVMLSGRDLYMALEDSKYVIDLVDKEYEDNKYRLTKKVHKPVSSLGKLVYTAVDFGHGYVLPYEDPGFCTLEGDIRSKINSSEIIYPENYNPLYELQPDFIKIQAKLQELKYPEEWRSEIKLTYAKHEIMKYLKEKYPEGDIECTSIGKEILVIELHQPAIFKGFLFWRKLKIKQEDRIYLLFCNEEGEVVFREADQDEIEK